MLHSDRQTYHIQRICKQCPLISPLVMHRQVRRPYYSFKQHETMRRCITVLYSIKLSCNITFLHIILLTYKSTLCYNIIVHTSKCHQSLFARPSMYVKQSNTVINLIISRSQTRRHDFVQIIIFYYQIFSNGNMLLFLQHLLLFPLL